MSEDKTPIYCERCGRLLGQARAWITAEYGSEWVCLDCVMDAINALDDDSDDSEYVPSANLEHYDDARVYLCDTLDDRINNPKNPDMLIGYDRLIEQGYD